MARRRKDGWPDEVKLKQPDRARPTDQTLLQLANERGRFDRAHGRQEASSEARVGSREAETAHDNDEADDGPDMSPAAERVLETLLWSASLSMLHLTLDVLVQNQYAIDISWLETAKRAGQALLVFGLLFFVLHPHPSAPILLPGLQFKYQGPLRQAVFFIMSASAGCYLIYITNRHGYLAVMKQAPPLGCLWVWSIIELDLPLAVLSLSGAGLFLWRGGYSFR